MNKKNKLLELYKSYKQQFGDVEYVFGDGSPDSKVVLIGEAPGKDEVRLGKPFVGAAGKKLSEFLEVIDLKREDIYITNSIKYRLCKLNEKTGRIINRPAKTEEIEKSRQYLLKEIEILNPLYVVTLGNVPLKAVTGDKKVSIGSMHGMVFKTQVLNCIVNLFPLYHPASIIYNRLLANTYYEDIHKLKIQLLQLNNMS